MATLENSWYKEICEKRLKGLYTCLVWCVTIMMFSIIGMCIRFFNIVNGRILWIISIVSLITLVFACLFFLHILNAISERKRMLEDEDIRSRENEI